MRVEKKLHVFVMAYERVVPLRLLMDCFLLQTYPHWRMTVVHDGAAGDEIKTLMVPYEGDPRIIFFSTPERLGHNGFPNRKLMLEFAEGDKGDFILFTNDDNYYVPHFVEYMLDRAMEDVGVVYCDTSHSHINHKVLPGKLEVNHIDMGAFITEMRLAKEVGFNHDTFAADGLFAEECAARCREKGLSTVHIPAVLFVHN